MTRSTFLAALLLGLPRVAVGQIADLDADPIRYKTAVADNPVGRLDEKLSRGEVTFRHTDDHGYLASVLKALDVPQSSQVLVFSKTSFQRDRITPKTPRALYFNDEVTVGFCLRGDVLEFSVADPTLGTAFYTLDQDPTERAQFIRQTDNCLTCHGSSRTQGYPGHLLRSVFSDRFGQPILSAGTYMTDHASPFDKRWGGWYVTGTHGPQTHMGNFVAQTKRNPEAEDNSAGQNVTDLRGRFTVANYLTPHSDLIALMVFEHQTEMQNRLARAALLTRQAVHYQATLNKELGEPAGKVWESTGRRIAAAGEPVVQYLLFSGETKLTAPIAGTSGFAEEFAKRGPVDKQGRSLRQFDLTTRLFKYPCSPQIYTAAFAKLPAEVKDFVIRRLHEVLTGKDTSAAFAHLSADDRRAVREILKETLPGLPAWF